MGAHARPNRIHRTGVRIAMVALVGAALPISAGGLAQAATPDATHSADENGRQGGEATTTAAQKHGAQQHAAQRVVRGEAAGAQDANDQDAPQIKADHAFLLDARDGSQERELWGGAKADESVSMASTTKIMTALVVLKHPEWLGRQITVTQEYRDYVQKVGGSTADLQTGDTLTVEQLLHALLIPSGDDAAMALADNLGTGSTAEARIADFVHQMNVEAQQLGLTGTNFDSFDGVSQGNNHSTARDLAKLGQRAMLKPVFADIVKKKQFKTEAVAANGHIRYYTWDTTNKLLSSYDGALGIKTGSGPEAGYALVFAAERDNRTLVGAILKDDAGRFDDATKMLDWGFAH
ncbi:D-alanyl-D-alanine carboxypeptidase [Streptomyces sp. RPA4-5]|uniref:D-alanyl-D-alanine carboxypeptidase family protein n=1 Tax=Streptomyces TaxID=1883 RepID=UPI00143E920A|nr:MULTISPECIES: serine hydrolase [Streptomyces]MCX4635806.1 serine hydrolase [Streptomyces platensis]QIY58889.1 D-alanyl-D-alanine carboxypeptidase [Streptomyces sp. RPA4-5]WJY42172.1 serine hydrolase [Streptomyces sp. P9-2B-2]